MVYMTERALNQSVFIHTPALQKQIMNKMSTMAMPGHTFNILEMKWLKRKR